jgi:short-subunit dehydrogenase
MNRYRAILTGATGGIGSAIAAAIAPHCELLLLVGRDAARLAQLEQKIALPGLHVRIVQADLTTVAGRDAIARAAVERPGGVDLLINNAGVSEFAWFGDQNDEAVARILGVNALAPMLLTRRLLSTLQLQPAATIVNVGSVFGYLGYPGCAAYSASKFALRGFTEALRREMADGPVRVLYFAPRATRTALNSDALTALNEELGVAMDPPARVADEFVRMLRRPTRERLLGMPERLFARINQLLPLVDHGCAARDDPRIRGGHIPRPARSATSSILPKEAPRC